MTPQQIRVEMDVTETECRLIFGEAKARKKFRYDHCKDPKVSSLGGSKLGF